MRLDKYGIPIHNSTDIFNLIYKGKIDSLPDLVVEPDEEILRLQLISSIQFKDLLAGNLSVNNFDQMHQLDWFMPYEYKSFDIEKYIIELTPPWDPYNARVFEELNEYKSRGLYDLLRWLKYFVDHSTKNSIVWGVGRGSSVASYVLFLLGVHHIDSIKYNLDWREFLR